MSGPDGREASLEGTQVSNQLAMLVPSFDPAVDSVEIWTSKVELLLTAWPSQKIQELATRLILGCKGTAFQKLQLHKTEILVNDAKGIQKIVELVGGKWGAIPLEKKFELVEKALFRSQQKSDESSDSYLSRCDVVWTELISKKIDLTEIQAYILLRGSRLGAEDKKRVIVDSGAEKGGILEVKRVESAVRMIGSGFFQDMVGAKRDKGLKTYDHTAFSLEEQTESPEAESDAFWTQEETLDDSMLESLAAEDDEDAALVLQFEDAIAETVQNDPELSAFYTSYQDARKRLSEKVRFRGFWAVKRGEKGSGKKGKVKGKNKGTLANRIANSYCRICMKKGHWKNECPSRNANPSGSASTVPTSLAIASEVPPEMIHLAVTEETPPSYQHAECFVMTHDFRRIVHKMEHKWGHKWGNKHNLGKNIKGSAMPSRSQPTSEVIRCQPDVSEQLSRLHQLKLQRGEPFEHSVGSEESSLFASTGSIGVVDLGASQTVIGSRQVPELLQQIPDWVRSRVKRKPCNLVFRFGNQQTLVSRQALMLPLGAKFFRIAVVDGNTPFLISSSFLKGIQAVIDTDRETIWSKLLNRYLSVCRNPKNLFLMDLNQLWQSESDQEFSAVKGWDHLLAESASEEQKGAQQDSLISSSVVPTEKFQEKAVLPACMHEVGSQHVMMDTCSPPNRCSETTTASCLSQSLAPSSDRINLSSIRSDSDHVDRPEDGNLSCTDRGKPVTGSQDGTAEDDSSGVGKGEDRVRSCQDRTTVSNGLCRSQVDGLVRSSVRRQHE